MGVIERGKTAIDVALVEIHSVAKSLRTVLDNHRFAHRETRMYTYWLDKPGAEFTELNAQNRPHYRECFRVKAVDHGVITGAELVGSAALFVVSKKVPPGAFRTMSLIGTGIMLIKALRNAGLVAEAEKTLSSLPERAK